MKIDGSSITSALTGKTSSAARSNKTAPQTGSGSTALQDSVTLSSTSAQIKALETSISGSTGFDAAKVNALKLAISQGQFTVNPGAIADKLISSTRELLAQHYQ